MDPRESGARSKCPGRQRRGGFEHEIPVPPVGTIVFENHESRHDYPSPQTAGFRLAATLLNHLPLATCRLLRKDLRILVGLLSLRHVGAGDLGLDADFARLQRVDLDDGR